ncbi:MAG TPA: acyl-CoA dehydrogenase [Bacteroidetes bacterium]|nr:acyl-CoA dehydrogenase [Bacteroidota bacterium]
MTGIAIFLTALALAFQGAPLWLWTAATAVVLYLTGASLWLWFILGLPLLFFNIPSLRRTYLTAKIVAFMKAKGFLPSISETERTAIEAGTIWIDGELFSGKPDYKKILDQPPAKLTAEEKAFIDGPTEELCRMVDDWEVYKQKDFPPEVWEFVKKNKFFGLIIPKEYGGLGFSATAHSAVVSKITSRCIPLATTVMVPNALGPAELLMHYGTDEQKKWYLPRLATGEDIPCFALTEPGAGSDAGAMTASGEIFEKDGALYMRLNWNKRYITLGAIATVLGLAFKLRDPKNLLGKGEEPGITCALIPADTPGVVLGMRHDPLGVPFYNSPVEGHDVVLPVDAIIGGPEQAGKGWRMLMESLAVGRGISLPSTAAGNARLVTRVAGAYARVRKQFGLSIGKFGGIEEPLARLGGLTYLLEAARKYTCSGLDTGQKPAVVTAIAKYSTTELGRKGINDAMDILGGAAISRGPRNLLAHIYINTPISITVEGANILTRTLMIFGQGAIRCHPYALQEINALEKNDLTAFDKAFWAHTGHVFRNGVRAALLSLTRGYLSLPPVSGPTARYFRKLSWASASFAFFSDLAMAVYGGNLKRMEQLTGRFSDIFAWMYLASTVLHRYEAEGRKQQDLPFVHWSLQYAFARMQEAFDGMLNNFGTPALAPFALWSRLNPLSTGPSDRLSSKVAQLLQIPGEQRDRLTEGIYIPAERDQALGRLEYAFTLAYKSDAVFKKIRQAVKAGEMEAVSKDRLVATALESGVITTEEAAVVAEAEEARNDAIQVDAFSLEDYMGARPSAKKNKPRPTRKKTAVKNGKDEMEPVQ